MNAVETNKPGPWSGRSEPTLESRVKFYNTLHAGIKLYFRNVCQQVETHRERDGVLDVLRGFLCVHVVWILVKNVR